ADVDAQTGRAIPMRSPADDDWRGDFDSIEDSIAVGRPFLRAGAKELKRQRWRIRCDLEHSDAVGRRALAGKARIDPEHADHGQPRSRRTVRLLDVVPPLPAGCVDETETLPDTTRARRRAAPIAARSVLRGAWTPGGTRRRRWLRVQDLQRRRG